MRNLLAIWLLFVAEAFAGERHFASPNVEFEAYTIAANEDGTGMKLFLRRANSLDAGMLLAQNARWIDAKWSTDSRFLAVINHPDGHIAYVYVFGVTAANAAASPSVTLPHAEPTHVRCPLGCCGLALKEA
jgi:hypothetical protein